MLIYPLFVAYFGFNAWCMYMAWNRPQVFEGYLTRFDSYTTSVNAFTVLTTAYLFSSSIGGMVYSWYQH